MTEISVNNVVDIIEITEAGTTPGPRGYQGIRGIPGKWYAYDPEFNPDMITDGCPVGGLVLRSDGLGYWLNTVEDNTTDPEVGDSVANGWLPQFTPGQTTIGLTSSDVTLTPVQYGLPIIILTGTISADIDLIFPSIYGKWTIINKTSGSFIVTCKTLTGEGVIVNSLMDIVCDGTDILKSSANISIYVEDFGAIADGITDCSAAFQKAIDYAGTLVGTGSVTGGGVEIKLLGPQYLLSSTVTITKHGIGISGVAGRGTLITGPETLFDIGDYTNAIRVRGVELSNLNMVSSSATTTYAAIKLYRTTTSRIENCFISNFYIHIDCVRASTTMLKNVRFSNPNRTTQALAFVQMIGTDETAFAVPETYTPGGGMHITDCEGLGASSVASVDTTSAFLIKSVDGFYMTQCHFMGCGTIIDIAPEATATSYMTADIWISNLYCDEPSEYSTTYNMQIRGTVKEVIARDVGATVKSFYQNIHVVNSKFRGNALANRNVYIHVLDGDSWYDSGNWLEQIHFIGCNFRQTLRSNIYALGANTGYIEVRGLIISGCTFDDYNSTSTVDIGGAISVQVNSGIITNNMFGPPAGTCYYIVFGTTTYVGADDHYPVLIVSNNDFSNSSASIAYVRTTLGDTGINQATVIESNVLPGPGRKINQQYKLTTTSMSPVNNNIWTYTIAYGAAGIAKVSIVGSNVDASKTIVYSFIVGFRCGVAGSALSNGTSDFDPIIEWADGCSNLPSATLSGNSLIATVVSDAVDTWTWVCDVDLVMCK